MPSRLPNPETRRSEQVLLRLTAREYDVLDAAAHLNRQTVNAYAYLLLQNHVSVLANDPYVRADLANRADFQRGVGGTVELTGKHGRRELGLADGGTNGVVDSDAQQ